MKCLPRENQWSRVNGIQIRSVVVKKIAHRTDEARDSPILEIEGSIFYSSIRKLAEYTSHLENNRGLFIFYCGVICCYIHFDCVSWRLRMKGVKIRHLESGFYNGRTFETVKWLSFIVLQLKDGVFVDFCSRLVVVCRKSVNLVVCPAVRRCNAERLPVFMWRFCELSPSGAPYISVCRVFVGGMCLW